MTGLKLIYIPRGRAREYAELALNIYSGCQHGCTYCYGPGALRIPREEFVQATLRKQRAFIADILNEARTIAGDPREILLCFTCDPYQPVDRHYQYTRKVIEIFIECELSFTILTKAGIHSIRDFDLLEGYENCRYGISLSHLKQEIADEFEPHADSVYGRAAALIEAHRRGIKTWISIEPVLDPLQALRVIAEMHPWTDSFKVGKLNHMEPPRPIDWKLFGEEAEALLKSIGKPYKLKNDLLKEMGRSVSE